MTETRPLLRIVLTGPECTGKTTLATWLGATLRFPVSQEGARLLAAQRGGLETKDVEDVARLEIALEEQAEEAARQLGSRGVVHDTDLFSTVVYARYYHGVCPAWIEEAAFQRRSDLYLLLLPDIPYQHEPLQRAPRDERARQLEAFEQLFEQHGIRAIPVTGLGLKRQQAAWKAVTPTLTAFAEKDRDVSRERGKG